MFKRFLLASALLFAPLHAHAQNAPASTFWTYHAAIPATTQAATATDIFCITGSATRTVAIKAMQISGTATTATTTDLVILKRSTANTGGTPVAATLVSVDSNDPASTVSVFAYSANPTTGTLVGNLHADKYTYTGNTGAPANTIIPYIFGPDPVRKPIILRGTAQSVCFNANGITPAGAVFSADVIWVEY